MLNKKLLITSFDNRHNYITDEGTNCCRLFNGDGDGFDGLTIDKYNEFVLFQFFRRELYQDRERIFSLVIESICQRYGTVKGILFKDRTQNAGKNPQDARDSVLVWGQRPPAEYTIRQNNMVLAVDLEHGQSTGVFLDMKEIRDMLVPFYGGCRSMLNLFSYTGAFSVHGLLHGVSRAVNVDLSKSVLKRARKNYVLNGIACDERDFVAEDAGDWMKVLRKKEQHYDMVIYDPPTFSRNGKKTFNIRRDYRKHLTAICEIAKGGYVLSSVNAASVSKREYFSYHPEDWTLVFSGNESGDFPYIHEPYLKAGLWKLP
ncbi:MAG TPA: class I SAM-dependent methyltransferase [Spirochaetota bacterium]|nr:class I SAM-dependent methyltransferase [Spirochaetota bacterium]HPJ36885.1 class I SAM-dependent methyltransferase [Spirochaetota bacterium]HPQ51948.1 class I SAM-dependent methyltransferase [Spirochaetota bacterium]